MAEGFSGAVKALSTQSLDLFGSSATAVLSRVPPTTVDAAKLRQLRIAVIHQNAKLPQPGVEQSSILRCGDEVGRTAAGGTQQPTLPSQQSAEYHVFSSRGTGTLLCMTCAV